METLRTSLAKKSRKPLALQPTVSYSFIKSPRLFTAKKYLLTIILSTTLTIAGALFIPTYAITPTVNAEQTAQAIAFATTPDIKAKVLIIAPQTDATSNRQTPSLKNQLLMYTRHLFPYPPYSVRYLETSVAPRVEIFQKLAKESGADVILYPTISYWSYRTFRPVGFSFLLEDDNELYTRADMEITLYRYEVNSQQLTTLAISYHDFNDSLSVPSETQILENMMKKLERKYHKMYPTK